MKRTIEDWFNDYGESHQNQTNKIIHWICVPVIFFCVVALLSLLIIPNPMHWSISIAHIALFFAAVFYFRLSWKLAIVATLFAFTCLFISIQLQANGLPLLNIALSIFVLAWIGQFYGHHIEKKKPSFLNDVQFLLIGPLWLLGFIFKGLGIKY